MKYGVKINEIQMKTMAESYLILRNSDFVAKYFPFFLQTSVRSSFSLEISHSKSINFIYNNLSKRRNSISPEEKEMVKILAEPLSPRGLDNQSMNNSSTNTDAKNTHVDSKHLLTRFQEFIGRDYPETGSICLCDLQ